MSLNLFFAILIGYLLGNISTAYLYVRHVMHADIRELGSGNAGATNVNRILGLMPALRVFVLDMLKGVAAVLVGNWLAGANGAMAAGLAVVAGHDWPAVMGFRGGKGMATTVGVMLVFARFAPESRAPDRAALRPGGGSQPFRFTRVNGRLPGDGARCCSSGGTAGGHIVLYRPGFHGDFPAPGQYRSLTQRLRVAPGINPFHGRLVHKNQGVWITLRGQVSINLNYRFSHF